MSEQINRETVFAFFDAASLKMNAKKDYLIELDAALGDGDLGLTMSLGFEKMRETVHSAEDSDLGKLFMAAGMAIAKAVPSTMGTLVGSGFMKSAKALKGVTEMGVNELVVFMDQFVVGLMERGKAQPGDRTIIDSMLPASNSIKAAAEKSTPLAAAIQEAASEAEKGVEATKNMLGKFGRSVFYGEQVLGKPDQGAMVGWYIVEAWKTAICG